MSPSNEAKEEEVAFQPLYEITEVLSPVVCRDSEVRVDRRFQATFDTGGQSYSLTLGPQKTEALEFSTNQFTDGQILIFAKGYSVLAWISECPGGERVEVKGCRSYYITQKNDPNDGICYLGKDPSKKWYFNLKNNNNQSNPISLKNSATGSLEDIQIAP